MSVLSLPTVFDGTRFRSRLEARWAVFFRVLNIPARYELQPYRLPSGVYLPDFWLPSLSLHVEVKPQPHTPAMLGRLAELTHGTGWPCALLVETPAPHAYDVLRPNGRIERGALTFAAPALVQRAAHSARAYRFAA